ncbi:MAG TPA: FUSC family protein [Edaphobacter sp.]|jgi:uncharacterized membrane protein YccC|nr:FUSC family protein [Edaphobacter sp.]
MESDIRMALFGRVNWKHVITTAIAAWICLVLARWFRLSQGYWACISSIVMVHMKVTDTWAIARDRIAGTAVGALMGWGAVSIWHGHALIYGLAILLSGLLTPALRFKSGGGFAGVAATIVMLVPTSHPHWEMAEGRFIEVSLGILVSVIVSQLIWRESEID